MLPPRDDNVVNEDRKWGKEPGKTESNWGSFAFCDYSSWTSSSGDCFIISP